MWVFQCAGAIVPTCSEEIDSVWGIQWNETDANTTAASSCGSGVLGQYLHIHFAMVALFMHIGCSQVMLPGTVISMGSGRTLKWKTVRPLSLGACLIP